MLKVVGALLILAGAAGYSQLLVANINRQYQELIAMKEFLLLLGNEMIHFKREMPQAFAGLAVRLDAPFDRICTDMVKELAQYCYATPSDAWKKVLDENRGQLLSNDEELTILYDAGRVLDQHTSYMQEEEIGILDGQLESRIRTRQQENVNRKRISRYASVSVGLLLIIVLM